MSARLPMFYSIFMVIERTGSLDFEMSIEAFLGIHGGHRAWKSPVVSYGSAQDSRHDGQSECAERMADTSKDDIEASV